MHSSEAHPSYEKSEPAYFYEPLEPGRFHSTGATVGPWSADLQHGGPPAALMGRALERIDPRPDLRVARVSIEILRPVPLGELVIETEILRPGKRIQLLSATARAAGKDVLRALAWQIAVEPGRSPEVGDAEPVPPLPPAEAVQPGSGLANFPYGRVLEWRFVAGCFEKPGPATVWSRSRIPLVRGEELSALCRLLLMADSANGVSSELPLATWTFVPVDLTVVLRRLPRGEWLGMMARTTLEGDGVGMSETRIFDTQSYFAQSVHTLYVAPR